MEWHIDIIRQSLVSDKITNNEKQINTCINLIKRKTLFCMLSLCVLLINLYSPCNSGIQRTCNTSKETSQRKKEKKNQLRKVYFLSNVLYCLLIVKACSSFEWTKVSLVLTKFKCFKCLLCMIFHWFQNQFRKVWVGRKGAAEWK